MSPRDALARIHELHNAADHVASLAAHALVSVERGDYADALELLRRATTPAEEVASRLRRAIESAEEA